MNRSEIDRPFADAVALRRELHMAPEVGLSLPLTQEIVLRELSRLSIPTRVGKELDSVVGLIRGSRPGPTVLLRADMDALPLVERGDVSFASQNPGAMHACGHDLHMAGLIGAAAVLVDLIDDLAGSIVLAFQPGEEGFFGARRMIEEGLLEAPSADLEPPSSAFAIHVNPWYPVGTIHTRPGAILASTDTFIVRFTGSAGHGSAPFAALDPIPAAAEFVLAAQTLVSRRSSPFDPVVLSITGLQAGSENAKSAIPEAAGLSGTVRTLSAEMRDFTLSSIERLATSIAQGHGLRADVSIEAGYPSTVNDSAVTRDFLRDLAGYLDVRELDHPLMGGEDFSYILEQVPGVLAFVGTSTAETLAQGPVPDNHSPTVRYDELALDSIIRAHVEFVWSKLGAPGEHDCIPT